MRNKHIKFLIGATFISLVSTSCDDFLNRKPDDNITEAQTFARFDKAQGIVTHVYGQCRDLERPVNYFNHFSSSGATDECEGINIEDRLTDRYNEGDWNEAITLGNDWRTGFFAIRQINIFLQGVQKYNTPDDPMEAGALQRRIGEAYFLRAYLHHLMLKKYGEIPYMTAVVYPGDNLYYPQESAHSIADKIEADCREAIKSVNPWNKNGEKDFGRADQGACLGLIATTRYIVAAPLYNGANDRYYYTGKRKFEPEYTYKEERWKAARDAAKAVIDFSVGGEKRFKLYQKYTSTDFSNALDNRNLNGDMVYQRLAKMFLTTVETYELYQNEAVWFVNPTKDQAWTGDIYPPSREGQSRMQPVQEQVDEYECFAKGPDGNVYGYSIFSDQAKAVDADGSVIAPKFKRTRGHKYYDDTDPYVNRDPRFYRDIIYHGAPYRNRDANAAPMNTAEGADRIGADKACTTGYYLRKFQMEDWKKSGGTSGYQVTHPMWRLPEFIYIYAEAINRLQGPNKEIYDMINDVRARSFMAKMAPEAMTDQRAMQEYIDREWRVEYFYENKRIFRCRLYLEPIQPDQLSKESVYNSMDPENAAQNYISAGYGPYPKCQRAINGMRPIEDESGQIVVNGKHYSMKRFKEEDRVFKLSFFLWPIHRDEIRRSLGTLQQNPFWSSGVGS